MKCIIVDDEPIARKGMQRLVESRHELQSVGYFPSAEEASLFLTENEVDLIFLDIDMPEINGLDFARQIPRNCLVIFTTAYSEYALESYEVEAIDYLVKPLDTTRFNKAVNKALLYHSLLKSSAADIKGGSVSAGYITVKSERKFVRIPVESIIYVEGMKDYIIIHTENRKTITRMTIKAIEEILPGTVFLRVSKSYIVNINCIDSFNYNDVFIAKTEIPISAMYRDKVLATLLGH